jgi:hypothetical protein
MQIRPRPFALSRQRACALCAAPGVHGRFALSRQRACALCAAPGVHGRLCRHVHAPLLCEGSVRVLFAQPQVCKAAYADTSTPLCFVKAACVCSLRSPRCAWPLMQTRPRPFALSRQRACALCAAPGVQGRLCRHVHAPLLCQGSVRVLFAQPVMAFLVQKKARTSLCFFIPHYV